MTVKTVITSGGWYKSGAAYDAAQKQLVRSGYAGWIEQPPREVSERGIILGLHPVMGDDMESAPVGCPPRAAFNITARVYRRQAQGCLIVSSLSVFE